LCISSSGGQSPDASLLQKGRLVGCDSGSPLIGSLISCSRLMMSQTCQQFFKKFV
jgi:hypothetical protein